MIKIIKQNYAAKALSGAFWLSCLDWTRKGGAILATIVLARILPPKDIGLLALGMMVINIFDVLRSPGLTTAAIRKKNIDSSDYNVCWTFENLLISILAGTAIIFIAPLASYFFQEPRLTNILRALSLIVLFRAIENNAITVFIRDLMFKERFYFQMIPAVVNVIITISLVFYLKSVWAVVIGAISEGFVRVITSYYFYPHFVHLDFNFKKVRELFSYGRWIMGLNFLNVIKTQGDKFILGIVSNAISLGYFQVGTKFSNQISSIIQSLMLRVFFPIYSKVQHDKHKLLLMYKYVLHLTIIIILPLCIGLFVCARPTMLFVFGDKWEPSIIVMKILIMSGLLHIIVGTSSALFRGNDNPHFEFIMSIVYILVLLPSIFILTKMFGFPGTAIGILCAELSQVPLWLWLLKKSVNITIREIFVLARYPMFAAALMVLLIWTIEPFCLNYNYGIQLMFMFVIGAFTYLLLIFLGWYKWRWESLNLLFANLKIKLFQH